jgi:hypothetical protein
MDNFNLKGWLIENKAGVYSKTDIPEEFDVEGDETVNRGDLSEVNPAALGVGQAVADREMQKQDDQNGDEVDNASMGVVAEAKIGGYVEVRDEELEVDGVPTIVSCDVDYELDKESQSISDYKIKITELEMDKEDVGEYIPVSDPKAIAQVENRLNTDEALAKSILNRIDTSSATRFKSDIPETVGYVMKTKPSDPLERAAQGM